jgi:hypothetical protein
MAAGQGGHARLQGHIELSRSVPGGQIQNNQGKGPAVQQFYGRGGRQLGLLGEDHGEMAQIQAGLGHIGRVGGRLGIAHPGHPLARPLAFQQQLQSGAEMPSALAG